VRDLLKRRGLNSHARLVTAKSRLSTRGRGNRITVGAALLQKVHFDIRGNDNVISIDDAVRLNNVTFHIRGENNHVSIGRSCRFTRGGVLWLDGFCSLTVGARSTFEQVHLAVTEATHLQIGDDCMFATEVEVRTGDSHSVLERASGSRLNRAADVVVSDRVWVGVRAMILKGVHLPSDTVVGAAAVVTRTPSSGGLILAGNPAREIRAGIHWSRERT